MKFPIFFRILAVFNILGALLLIFALIVMATARGALVQVNPHIYAQLWLIALWLLAISFAWFFASRQAYGLLIINFISALAIAMIIILMGWGKISARESDVSMLIITALIPAIYSLFSLFGLFYKPIREWASSVSPDGIMKANRSVALAAVFSLGVFIAAGYGMQSYKPNQHETVSCEIFYSKQDSLSMFKGYFPFDILPGDNIDIPLMDIACFDAVRIAVSSAEQRPWVSARLVDSEGKEQTLSFKKTGEFYLAKVQQTCSNRVTIYIPPSPDSVAYSVPSLQLVRHYSLFEENPTDNVSMMPTEGEGDGDYFEAVTEYGAAKISSSDVPELVRQTMTILLRERSWNFEDVDNDEGGWIGPDKIRVGIFKHGLASMREYGVQMISQYVGGDYIKEDYIPEIFGRQLFDASPADEYNESYVPFRRVNAETITWIADNFIPDPSAEISIEGSPTASKIYEGSFQRLARLLVETRQHLHHNTDIQTEKDAYEEEMTHEGFHGPSWLLARYENLLVDQYGPDYTNATFSTPLPPLLAGFWLRRELDGSAGAIWSALGSFMMQYDAGWYMKNTEQWDGSEGD